MNLPQQWKRNAIVGVLALIAIALVPMAGATAYYSQGNGSPTTLASWNTVRAGGGSTPANFTTAGNQFIIQNTHTMTTTAAWTVSGTGSKIEIESGGWLKETSTFTVSVSGGATIQVDGGGTFEHNINQGTIPIATWLTGSTLIISGQVAATSGPSGMGQAFYNVTWNCPSATATSQMGLGAATGFSIAGTFTVVSTGTGMCRFTSTAGTVLSIANIVVTGGTLQGTGSGSVGLTVNISGNVTVNGGLFDLRGASGTGANGTTLNIAGNYSLSSGTNQVGSSSGQGLVNFAGPSSTFTYTSGLLELARISWTVNSGASLTMVTCTNLTVNTGNGGTFTNNGTLNMGTNLITGTGSFVNNPGATLSVGSSAGITSSGATGNIQTTTRSFSGGASYTYTGVAGQVTGNGLPATVKKLTVNSAGLALTTSPTTVTNIVGSGAVGPDIIVVAGGGVGPGNSPGTLTVTNLTLSALTTNTFELTNSLTAGSGVNDLVVILGTLTPNGGYIAVSNYGPNAMDAGDYTLFDYSAAGASESGATFNATPIWLSAITNTVGTSASIFDDTGAKKVVLRISAGCTAPTTYSVTGGGAYCPADGGIAVGLVNSETGIDYLLRTNGVYSGNTVSGSTGLPISFGNQTTVATYTVLATNLSTACTAIMAGSAFVTANASPVVTGGPTPSSASKVVGESVSFTITATGTGLTYQWQKNGVNLAGANITGTNSPTLTINPVAVGDTAGAGVGYTCVVSGTCTPSATSGEATLMVTCGTATTSNPGDQIATTGATATFSVSAVGSSLPTYQWQVDAGGGFVNVNGGPGVDSGADGTGGTTASFTTVAAIAGMNNYQYRCIVSVACDSSSATSAAATLIVADPSNTSFRSASSGLWTNAATWSISVDGVTFYPASSTPTDSNSTNIVVLNGHTVTVSSAVAADQVVVNSGGQITVGSGQTLTLSDGTGTDLDVSGTINNSGTITIAGGVDSVVFRSTGTYNHAEDGGTIPTATWQDGSLCQLTGLTATALVGGNFQDFYDFTYNCTSQSAATILFDVPNVRHIIKCQSTNGKIWRNYNTIATTRSYGYLQVAGGTMDLWASSGNLTPQTTTVTNDVTISGGATLQWSGSSAVAYNFNVGGNWSNSGTVTVSTTGVTNTFNGTSQGLGGSSVTTFKNLTIANGSTVTASTTPVATLFNISGGGKFIQAAAGAIPGTTKNLDAASTYELQVIPTGFGSISWGNLVINFSGGTSMQGSGTILTVQGDLRVVNTGTAQFRLNANTPAAVTTTIGGDLIIDGGTCVFTSGSATPTVNVSGDVVINGGTLQPASSTGVPIWTMGGNYSNSGGTLVMGIKKGATPNTTKLTKTASTGNLNYGGTLTVTALSGSGSLANGDVFDLFDADGFTGAFSTMNLPSGGVAHWNTSDLSIGGSVTYTNANPVATSFTNGVAVGGSTTSTVIGKFAAATDADGDAVSISAVSTPTSGTATIVGGTNIIYTSTVSAASDSFTYTVSDGLGGTDTKTVTVIISSPEGFNKLAGPINNGNGTFRLDYLGIPGLNYALDESPDLVAPYAWFPVLTNTASGTGAISYTVPLSYPSGSFRTRYVP